MSAGLIRVLFVAALISMQGGCRGGAYVKHHSLYGSVSLIAQRDALAALCRGDLSEARRVLEAKAATSPNDPEIDYTLGCVDLMQSNDVADRAARRAMQARGWQRVESASGRFYPADKLLAHAYLVGRWGKGRNRALYEKYVELALSGGRAQSARLKGQELYKRSWVLLSPP